VHGVFERLRIDMQADRLAIHIMGQSRIAVAGQAFICGRFRRIFF